MLPHNYSGFNRRQQNNSPGRLAYFPQPLGKLPTRRADIERKNRYLQIGLPQAFAKQDAQAGQANGEQGNPG